jgi:hypothetical protein
MWQCTELIAHNRDCGQLRHWNERIQVSKRGNLIISQSESVQTRQLRYPTWQCRDNVILNIQLLKYVKYIDVLETLKLVVREVEVPEMAQRREAGKLGDGIVGKNEPLEVDVWIQVFDALLSCEW